MNPTMAPARHVHLDIELDPQKFFHYRSQGQDARQVRLRRGDTLTFTCGDPFSVNFVRESPFGAPRLESHRESLLQSREWYITAAVRESARDGVYTYTVELRKEGRIFQDGPEDTRIFHDDPEILIESTEL